jgi:hypothetical protein
MKTLLKLGVAAVFTAVFAGASAGEATIDEIVVVGKRPPEALPRIEVERPTMQDLKVEPVAPVIDLPRIEVATLERKLS